MSRIKTLTVAVYSLLAVLVTLDYLSAIELKSVSIEMLSGESVVADLDAISVDGTLTGQGLPAGLNIGDVLSIKTSRTAIEGTGIQLVTADLGVIPVRGPVVEDEDLVFRSQMGVGRLPLQGVRAIVWQDSEAVQRAVKSPSSEFDRIFVTTKDGELFLDGILELIDRTHVHVNYKGESKKINLKIVKAVVTADLGLKKPEGSFASLKLTDGSLLKGVIRSLEKNRLALQMNGVDSIEISTSLIVEINLVSDRLLYLSNVAPIEANEKSVFAIKRSWRRDRSVENNPLTIRDSVTDQILTFAKGLGTHSYSRLVFENTNGFDQFHAVVGIDSETKGRGNCQMVVLGDGIELWAKQVTANDGATAVNLDISGIKQVELIVYPGDDFDLGDHANWCDAKFIKTK